MSNQPGNLHELLQLRHWPIGDPPSWIIERLPEEELIAVRHAFVDFQVAHHTAMAKFFEALRPGAAKRT